MYLYVAALRGELKTVRYLLSMKLDPNSLDDCEWTPLHCAVAVTFDDREVASSVVKVLVENGANVQAKGKNGQTALHLCAQNYGIRKEVIQYLIEKGIGVNDRDNDGDTPLH